MISTTVPQIFGPGQHENRSVGMPVIDNFMGTGPSKVVIIAFLWWTTNRLMQGRWMSYARNGGETRTN